MCYPQTHKGKPNMITLILTATLALAAPDCDADVVSLNLRHVSVDGMPVKVNGRSNRTSFEMWLHECRPDALPAFRAWRSRRRIVNWTATGGSILLWPLYGVTVWAGVDASNKRSEFDMAVRKKTD